MQFREVGQRVQCHVAWYDAGSKRTRQTMVYSFLAAAPRKPSALELRPGFGTPEQRQAWTNEIWMEIFNRAVRQGADDPASLPSKLNDIAMTIIMQFETPPVPFSAQEMERMRASIRPLARFLELDVDAVNATAKKKGKRT